MSLTGKWRIGTEPVGMLSVSQLVVIEVEYVRSVPSYYGYDIIKTNQWRNATPTDIMRLADMGIHIKGNQ